jgi:large subunit ribosomal protein L4
MMITVPVYTATGETSGEIELNAAVFGVSANEPLVHQAVVATLANQRQGNADTKTRGEVKHTTRKVWRQKGTGRARQGMRSAPHWKGGGVVFGPHPRDYHQALPKKMKRQALLMAVSARVNDGGVKVLDTLEFTEQKTKLAAALLATLGVENKKVLVVVETLSDPMVRAFRNLPLVVVTTSAMLGVYDTLAADVLLFTKGALALFETLKQVPVGGGRLPELTGEKGAGE